MFVVGVLIVVFLVWLGYQQGRNSTDGASSGDLREAPGAHSQHPQIAARRERCSQERNKRLASISLQGENWINHYLDECESPAESAFLRAIVAEYALLPVGGTLKGQG